MTAPLIPTPAPWIDNTGTVPDGVEADTAVELHLRNGRTFIWRGLRNVPTTAPDLWSFGGLSTDIIRWRKVQP